MVQLNYSILHDMPVKPPNGVRYPLVASTGSIRRGGIAHHPGALPGQDNAILSESTSSHANCLTARRAFTLCRHALDLKNYSGTSFSIIVSFPNWGIRSVAINFLCEIGMNYSALVSKYSATNTEHPASAGSRAVVTVIGASRRAAAMIAAAHRIAFVIWNF